MSTSKVVFFLCLSFIGGIFLSSFFEVSQILLFLFSIFGLFFISVFWKYKRLFIFGFCILFFVLGIFRHQQVLLKLENSELKKLNNSGRKVELVGIVETEPDQREKITILKIKTEKGKILVTTRSTLKYQYGDKLKLLGKLTEPPVFEEFNYKNYLLKEGIVSTMSFPKIRLIERNQGNFLFSQILVLKNKLRKSIDQNLPSPHNLILGAIILGEKGRMPKELKEKLNIVGIRHITAISGLHVTILTTILMAIFVGLGFWRQQALFSSLIFIFLFLIFTGFQPSTIRASIMGGLYLLAQYFGRQHAPLRALFLAATLMLVKNPLLLKLDISFQLSFLAMLGIIYWIPVFHHYFRRLPNPFQLKEILAMTISAQIFTLPILIYNFGYISLVAPITNILILPTLYWLIFFGFIFSMVGIFSPFLGQTFALPAYFFLAYLLKIVDIFSKIPFSYITLANIHWIFVPFSYCILALLVFYFHKKVSQPFFLK